MTCKGCVHYNKAISEWPCNECIKGGERTRYTFPSEKGKPAIKRVTGRYRLVDKGGCYGLEQVK